MTMLAMLIARSMFLLGTEHLHAEQHLVLLLTSCWDQAVPNELGASLVVLLLALFGWALIPPARSVSPS
jgi:hypothetical protein